MRRGVAEKLSSMQYHLKQRLHQPRRMRIRYHERVAIDLTAVMSQCAGGRHPLRAAGTAGKQVHRHCQSGHAAHKQRQAQPRHRRVCHADVPAASWQAGCCWPDAAQHRLHADMHFSVIKEHCGDARRAWADAATVGGESRLSPSFLPYCAVM